MFVQGDMRRTVRLGALFAAPPNAPVAHDTADDGGDGGDSCPARHNVRLRALLRCKVGKVLQVGY